MKRHVDISLVLIATAIALSLTGCFGEKSTPDWDFMPDMYQGTNFKAQSEDPLSADGSSLRVPPEGTIPRGFSPYKLVVGDTEKAGTVLVNPLPRTQAVLARGQKMYNTYCFVCHGPGGKGDGPVIPKFPQPPPLTSEKIRNYKDGSIFHVITVGQAIMPSYAQQVSVEDRWAIVHYIRALDRAANPLPEDLKGSKPAETK